MSVKIDTRPIWLILALRALRPLFFSVLALLFVLFLRMPVPEGLTPVGQSAIAVFLLCLVLWITNAIPLAVTGILAMVLVPVLGVLSRKETYSLFGNEAVFFILGAFILAGAVMHSGIAARVALFMMSRFGSSPKRLVLTIFLLAAGLSFVMSEHAVAAMLFPIVLEISKSLGLKPGRSSYGKILFFALAWGCVIGGVATFLGGARVPLAVGILQETTGSRIGFLEYSVAVFPLVMVMLLAGYIILKYFFPVDIDKVESAQGIVTKRLKGLGKMTYSEYSVGTVLLVTILAWAFLGESFGLSAVALISVVAMFVLRLVRWKDVEENVNWGIILMYGGAIVLGSALDKSGAAKWMVSSLVANWTGGPWTVFALFSFLSILLTAAISNAAVIAILLPVSIGMAQSLSIDPVLLTYAIAVPAGLDFMFPMGTPAIAIAASSNYISIRDSAKGGFIMFVLAWLAFNLVAALWWPLIGMGY
ncbi:MAG: DASS family sodium-coupled anion symporter [Deltaproteobacteria bacterium]|nr:DASS family sodium-coupled anion symporter [Deltaproteobacteria bacterium]MBZ0218902.1 DASS family sodium-coupled anion symporter [Deltaproteobacteria bacterium]